MVNKESYIGVEFYINDDKEMFDKLLEKRSIIEEELGFKLDWQRLENRSASRIEYYIKVLNFDDHSNYDELTDKAITIATKMRDVFKNYI